MGIEEGQITREFQSLVYPNPNSGEFEVELRGENLLFAREALFMEIMDMQGKLLLQREIEPSQANWHREQVSMPGLSKGMYFLRLRQDRDILSIHKIIKQ